MDEGIRPGLTGEDAPAATRSNLRVFGLGLAALWFAAGWRHWRPSLPPSWWLAAAAAGASLALLRPEALAVLYRPWMRLAGLIGRANVAVLLGVVYYGGFAPIGALLRRLGRDPLDERIDRGATTYWTKRASTAGRERFERPF